MLLRQALPLLPPEQHRPNGSVGVGSTGIQHRRSSIIEPLRKTALTFGFLVLGVLATAAQDLGPAPAETQQPAEDSLTPNATARFLAGLSVEGTPLAAEGSTPAWRRHAQEFDKQWARFESTQHAKIVAWREQALPENLTSHEPLFYMFSGPDFLYASAFFPNSPTYILCGTEPVGTIPDLETIPPPELDFALTNLRTSIESSLDWSFFITKNMKTDLARSKLSGTLPILYVFLARTNCRIKSVIPVYLDASGNFTNETKKTTHGIRIVFSTEQTAATQTLYYFTTDLADWAIKQNSGFLKFCQQQGRGVSLLKAASYLMHRNNFDTVRDFILHNSDLILQDESGIPYRLFSVQDWTLQLYGRYSGPINVFKEFPQPDLMKAYAETKPPQLDFSFGYQWQPSRSSLLVATPRELPVPAAENLGSVQGND